MSIVTFREKERGNGFHLIETARLIFAGTSLNAEFLFDPMQKSLSLNYSFVHIQNSPTNLVRDSKFFRIFVAKTGLVGLF